MRRRVMLGAVGAIAMIVSANAADIYAPGPVVGPASYKDGPVFAPWAGFYAGVNGGYGWSNNESFTLDTFVTATGGDFRRIRGDVDLSGGFGGGQIGYNWQGIVNPNWVLGVEADIQGSGIQGDGSHTDVVPGGCNTNVCTVSRLGTASVDVDWFGTVRGRLGYSFGQTLIYGTGGFAYGNVSAAYTFKDTATPPNSGRVSGSSLETGWVAGGGIEYKLSPAWSFKAEYQFIDLGTVTRSGPLNPPLANYTMRGETDVSFNTVRVGVNYHFLPVYEPLK